MEAKEIAEIREEAAKEAERDYNHIGEEKQQEFGRSKWTREERWVLLWATEYAKEKLT